RQQCLVRCRLCRSDPVSSDGYYAYRLSRWNPQRSCHGMSVQQRRGCSNEPNSKPITQNSVEWRPLLQIFVEPADRLIQSIGLVLRFGEEVAFAGINDKLRRDA